MNYELLLACYRSGQMSEAQFVQHCSENPAFAAWAEDRLAEQDYGAKAKARC